MTVLLFWAVSCLVIVLFFMAAKRSKMACAPKPEHQPTEAEIDEVLHVYEILGSKN